MRISLHKCRIVGIFSICIGMRYGPAHSKTQHPVVIRDYIRAPFF